MLALPKRFAKTSLPAIPPYARAAFARYDEPQPRVTDVVLACIKDDPPIAPRTSAGEDAIELGGCTESNSFRKAHDRSPRGLSTREDHHESSLRGFS